ncbi:hypothetical protein ACULL7_18140 [Xanthomonas arboricola pv. corylina]
MKPKSQSKLAFLKAQRTFRLTDGDLKGLAAARLRADRLKAKYSAVGVLSEREPAYLNSEQMFFSIMAGPTKKKVT